MEAAAPSPAPPAAPEMLMHVIDRTPEYEQFMSRLRDYHTQRGTTLDPEPRVGAQHLDLFKVFNHVVANGGYDKISEEKLAWRRMAAELGIYSNNEASTAFALKEKFYKNLAAFEISTVHGKEPPPKDILEDVTAKGAGLLTRTRDNYKSKRESNIGAFDSAASGDDGTPTREKPPADPVSSARASRGLREAPPQRVIFQPDTGPARATRQASNPHLAAHGSHANTPHQNQNHMSMPPMGQHYVPRGPSLAHDPPDSENVSSQVTSYQPRYLKPLQLRVASTPATAPNDFQKPSLHQRMAQAADSRQYLWPGIGFDGPNIYVRCLHALRSGVEREQAFALNHLVKISYERGDKYRFDTFPGLAEGLVDKALQVGGLFYHVKWHVSWDLSAEPHGMGVLDGNLGTSDILERINNLIEKDVPDVLQTESFSDHMLLITEAVLTIRNMVTLPENALNMSEFCPVKDLLCIILHLPQKDSLTEIKNLALDIAEQITPNMVLDTDDPLYRTLLSQLASDDRGTILTALRALGRISMNLETTNMLGCVPAPVLQRLSGWLLLNDDELIDACLDFLYQYTAVVTNLDHLLRSITAEGLIEQLVRLLSHGARRVQRELITTAEQKIPSRDEIARMPDDLLQDLLRLEEPDRVHRWVKCFFEEDNQSFVTQLAAWQAYQNAFVAPLKSLGQALITPADFIRNSTSVYKDSNAQVLREPGEAQQKFIIHGIRARARPLSVNGGEYGCCLWRVAGPQGSDYCGQLFLKQEDMWNHILAGHLALGKNEDGMFENVEKEFQCFWDDCTKYAKPTLMHGNDFARHVNSHVSATLPLTTSRSRRMSKSWIVPAKTMAVTFEETVTTLDERNPQLPPQAAGIPLSAVLVLRNIARNVVKTEAEEQLVKQQEGTDEQGGWNEKLFRPALPRLFEIMAENRPLSQYVTSLLDLIQTKLNYDSDD